MRPTHIHRSDTPLVLAAATYSPAARNNLGERTHTITLASLAAGAYRQFPKLDLGSGGTEDIPALWECTVAVEYAVAPTAGGLITVFAGFSDSDTAGTDNPGNLSGADAAYVGYGAAASDADEMTSQLTSLGSRPLSNDAVVQTMHFNLFVPRARYLVGAIKNGGSQAFQSDGVEMAIRFKPVLQGFR